ncbi:MAG: hypothetical protein HS099_05210 [Ardenticatenaceae bacterium]|nr:hypothetical protein [Ardenticatenaceae bacterium]
MLDNCIPQRQPQKVEGEGWLPDGRTALPGHAVSFPRRRQHALYFLFGLAQKESTKEKGQAPRPYLMETISE